MSNKSGVNTPAISIPKGGGSIKGIGEKFQPDLFTGTGNFSVPIITSPGRNDFGPQLTLQYSTGSGNGPFGLGWQISIPRITHKTEKGIPKYTDEDIFVMTGTEDLVPILDKDSNLPFYIIRENYTIYRYRPRTEGLFSRIEKWVRDDGDIHWRVITKENLTNIYGKNTSARLFDSKNTRHIFEWLLQETFDAKGNHILYEYENENPNIKISKIYEENRHYNQIYMRRILYGNAPDDIDDSKKVGPVKIGSDGTANGTKSRCYLFEVIFDYGDLPILPSIPYNALDFSKKTIEEWPIREDPFSTYRSGFEIRTLRRCQRVLMLHHFAEGELIGAPLVKSTNLEYSINKDTQLSMLNSVKVIGYKKSNSNIYISSEMPPVTFNYSEFKPLTQKYQSLTVNGNDFPSMALNNPNYTLIDLFGNGLPDILYTAENAYYYWRNLGEGNFDRRNIQHNMPIGITLSNPDVAIGDMRGDGLADIIIRTPSRSGFYEATPIGVWKPYKKFDQVPSFDLSDPNVQLVDLIGNGLSDIIVSRENNFLWHKCLGEMGYDEPRLIPRINDLNDFPDVFFNDPGGRIKFADMNGDSLNDIVMIHNGRIDYWTNLGYGRFSKRLTMENFPRFDYTFNIKRLFLVDLDGSGCDDLVYVDFNEVHFWFNQSGNKWSDKQTIIGTPNITDLSSIQFADIYGTGLKSLVWSYNYDEHPNKNYKILDFCGGVKPYLLNEMSNNMGATTRVKYAPSTKFYLEDLNNRREWVTNLPFPVQVVEKTETIDHINKTKLVNVFKYHHGYYDGREREFCGFGKVDQYDTEELQLFSKFSLHEDEIEFENKQKSYFLPPVLSKTWFHTGAFLDEKLKVGYTQLSNQTCLMKAYKKEFFKGDDKAFDLRGDIVETGDSPHEAFRALRGAAIRKEIYSLDKSPQEHYPYTVSENRYEIRQVQARKINENAIYHSFLKENVIYHYERNPSDPRISQQIILSCDDYGNITEKVNIAYPRRPCNNCMEEQRNTNTIYSWSRFINQDVIDENRESFYYIGILYETKTFEVFGLNWNWELSRKKVDPLQDSSFSSIRGPGNFKPYNYPIPNNLSTPEKRIIEWTRSYFRDNKDLQIVDPIGNLSHRLPLGCIESLGIPYESYKAVFTKQMLLDVYGQDIIKPFQDGKYHPHPNHPNAEVDAIDYWWIPFGRQSFNYKKFFQVEKTQDIFGGITITEYDNYGLLIKSIEDAWSHKYIENDVFKHKVLSIPNYRILQPQKVIDPNGTITEVRFDSLGMVTGTIVWGKDEMGNYVGDSFSGFVEDLEEEKILQYIEDPLSNTFDIIKGASTRLIYDLKRFSRERLPNVVYTISRVNHHSKTISDTFKVKYSFIYSDGFGREIQSKSKVESGYIGSKYVVNRWIGTGTKVYNNKGKEVRRYEPFYSISHQFSIEEHGVSTLSNYDPLGRSICIIHPNHTYEKLVFDSWKQEIWDVNDNLHTYQRFNPQTPDILPDHSYNPVEDSNVGFYFQNLPKEDYLPTWYDLRIDSDKAMKKWPDSRTRDDEKRTAEAAARHSASPSITNYDTLGRRFLIVEDNGLNHFGEIVYLQNRIKLDIEGNDIIIFDPHGTEISTNIYDIAGRIMHAKSKDSGSHLTFLNAVDKPVYKWDSNDHQIEFLYDELQRHTNTWIYDGSRKFLAEMTIYGHMNPNAKDKNLIGQIHKKYDGVGLLVFEVYDFKGNCKKKTRQVIKDTVIDKSFNSGKPTYLNLDWNLYDDSILDTNKYTITQEYDALNRVIKYVYPDDTIITINYNDLDFVESILVNGKPYVKTIKYNEKGQKQNIIYGNDVQTKFFYDSETFRLKRIYTKLNHGTSRIFQDLNYYYDPKGNISLIDDKARNGVNLHTNYKLMQHRRIFHYDSVYRLICAKGREYITPPSPLEMNVKIPISIDHTATRPYLRNYEYDLAGNLVKVSHKAPDHNTTTANWIKNFTYMTQEKPNENNRLKQIKTSYGQKNLSYDSNGNLIKIANNHHFYWDYANRLRATTISSNSDSSNISMHAQYFYDSDGSRIIKAVKCGNIVKTTIYIDGIYEIYQKKINLKLKEHRTYKHIKNGVIRIALIKKTIYQTQLENEPEILFQHPDYLGSSQIVTDKDGKFFNQEEYYPYGETSFGSYYRKRYRFSGKERDDETGLYYYGFRYYAPFLARWISCDPGGSIDSLNVYIFCKDNPITFQDPVGLQSKQRSTNKSNPKVELKRSVENESKIQNLSGGGSLIKSNQDKMSQAEKTKFPPESKSIQENKDCALAFADLKINFEINKDIALSIGFPKGHELGGEHKLKAPQSDISRKLGFSSGQRTEIYAQSREKPFDKGPPSSDKISSQLRRASQAEEIPIVPSKSEPTLLLPDKFSFKIESPPGEPPYGGIQVPRRLTPCEMASYTKTFNVEFSLVYKAGPGRKGGGGTYWLYSGDQISVISPGGPGFFAIYHTHPGGGPPSDVDILNIIILHIINGCSQKISRVVYPTGKTVPFPPKEIYNG